MGTNGYSTITLVDNGGAAITVPNQQVQLVLGTCSSGTVNQIISTRSASTLNNTCGWGPGIEAASLTCLGGGTVLFMKVATNTHGAATAVTHTGTGVSVMTVTLDATNGAFDTYYVKVVVMANATIGTGPSLIQISLDAGRTFSPTINLGTATTYAIPGTGITLNFTTATIVAGDTYTFSTTEPLWNDAGIQAALNAYAASPYAQQTVGSIHIVGGGTAGGATGSDATAIGGYLEAEASAISPLFNAAILSARDASPPSTWGGTGETESTWMSALLTDYSAVAQKRISSCAAYWNMTSALVNPLGMSPRFRRSVGYAIAQRTVLLSGPNRSWGRVKDGALAPIVVDPVNDPTDGFIYHNEAINPGLNAGRFVTTTTRSYLQGVYCLQANNMAATGAQINSWPLIAVANVASTILQQVGQQSINDDVRLLKTGLMDPRDLATIQNGLQSAIDANMTAQNMISRGQVIVDGSQNLIANGGQVPVTCILTQRQVILQVNVTLQYLNPNQAQAA